MISNQHENNPDNEKNKAFIPPIANDDTKDAHSTNANTDKGGHRNQRYIPRWLLIFFRIVRSCWTQRYRLFRFIRNWSQVILSAGLVYYTMRLVIFTKKQTRIQKSTVDSNKESAIKSEIITAVNNNRSALATQKAIESMSELTRVQTRPFPVLTTTENSALEVGKSFDITCEVENTGQTPAFHCSVGSRLKAYSCLRFAYRKKAKGSVSRWWPVGIGSSCLLWF